MVVVQTRPLPSLSRSRRLRESESSQPRVSLSRPPPPSSSPRCFSRISATYIHIIRVILVRLRDCAVCFCSSLYFGLSHRYSFSVRHFSTVQMWEFRRFLHGIYRSNVYHLLLHLEQVKNILLSATLSVCFKIALSFYRGNYSTLLSDET